MFDVSEERDALVQRLTPKHQLELWSDTGTTYVVGLRLRADRALVTDDPLELVVRRPNGNAGIPFVYRRSDDVIVDVIEPPTGLRVGSVVCMRGGRHAATRIAVSEPGLDNRDWRVEEIGQYGVLSYGATYTCDEAVSMRLAQRWVFYRGQR
jgi:hypothetical protein